MISFRMLNQVLAIMSHFCSLNCTMETPVQNSKGRHVKKKKKSDSIMHEQSCFYYQTLEAHLTALEKESFLYPLIVILKNKHHIKDIFCVWHREMIYIKRPFLK